jgi:hypothetical protein
MLSHYMNDKGVHTSLWQMKIKDKRLGRVLCRSIRRTWRATNVARRAITSYYANKCPKSMGTATRMRRQLDQSQVKSTKQPQQPQRQAKSHWRHGVASMMVSHCSKQEAWSHRSVLDEHENSSRENLSGEPGCMNTIEYWILLLNTMMHSESKLTFLEYPKCRETILLNETYSFNLLTLAL